MLQDTTRSRALEGVTPGNLPSCSLVICTRNRPQLLERCLESVKHQDHPPKECLVVDNASDKSDILPITEKFGVRYALEPRIGLSHARNTGARLSSSEVIAYLDDDSVADPGWLARILLEFVDPEVMAVTGRVLPSRVETEGEQLSRQVDTWDNRGEQRMVVDRKTPDWFAISNFGGLGIGAGMVLRRRAFQIWSGFDPRQGAGAPLGGQEHYACFSLIKKGYKAVYCPEAIVRHPYPATIPELRAEYLRRLQASTGFFTLLAVEEPGHLRELLKYVLNAFKRAPRPWRPHLPREESRIAPAWRRILALLKGPLLYAKCWLSTN